MVSTILSDFSRVLLFPVDRNYSGGLNALNKQLIEKLGIEHPFFSYFELNSELLEFYKQLKNKCSVNIFTSDTIQDRPEVKEIINPIFSKIFSAKDYGLSKKDAASYSFLADKLGKKPNEILYIDDQLDNINAAKVAGFNTIRYTNNSDIKEKLKSYVG